MHSVPRRRITLHAWLLPAGALFFLCGILLGSIASAWEWLLTLLLLALTACALGQGKLRWCAGAAVIIALGSLLSWQAHHPPMPPEGSYTVRGTVVQEVHWEAGGQVQTVLTDVTLNGTPQPDAYWTWYLDEEEVPPEWLQPGAHVQMTAEVYHPRGRTNPGGFDFRGYLLQRGIRFGVYGADGLMQAEGGFSLKDWSAATRHRLMLGLFDVMGEHTGAYAAAMLLGTQDYIPHSEKEAFRELGIAHILCVSGFHVGVLAAMLHWLLQPLPVGRRVRMAADVLVLAAYCLLSGGNAPVVRASILILWHAWVMARCRQVLPLHLLSATALTQLIFNPAQLLSPSFQLTYGAMLGLTMVYPHLRGCRSFAHPLMQKTWEAFCAALAAQVGILFPQLYWFGELPLLGLFLNMFVISLAGGLILLYWATLFALGIPGLREMLGAAASWLTQRLLDLVLLLSELPFASLWTRQADGFTFVGWVLVLTSAAGLLPKGLKRHRRKLLLTGVLLIALILLPMPQRDTTFTMLDVGDANAAVLQDQDMTVVIDTGEDGQALASYLHQRRQGIEALIITHMHTDHGGGLRALIDQGIPVETCYLPVDANKPVIDEEMRPLLVELQATGTQFVMLSRGDEIELPSGCIRVLWPLAGRIAAQHDANEVCLVLQAEVHGVTMLLPGDLPADYAPYALQAADVFLLPHHGSKTAVTPEVLARVDAQVLLLSNASESREAHIAQLAGMVPLYTTAADGAVTLRFTGDGAYTVEPFMGR